MQSPDLQGIIAQLQAGKVGAQSSVPAQPHAGLQAWIQTELNSRLLAAQAQFEQEVQTAIAETSEIQNSDLVTLRISIGEEACFRRMDKGSVEDLVSWLVQNGWVPVGTPTAG